MPETMRSPSRPIRRASDFKTDDPTEHTPSEPRHSEGEVDGRRRVGNGLGNESDGFSRYVHVMKRCGVCTHPNRPAIDLAIATGLSIVAIGQRHGLSKDAVWRHGKDHLTPELKAALALKLIRREGDTRAVLLEEGAGAVEALRAIRAPLFGRFLAAVDVGDDRAAAALAGRLHEGLALSARLTGQLAPAASVSITNVVLHPGYQALRAELLRILARFPAARDAVAAAFRSVGEAAAAEMARSVPRTIEATATEVSDAA